MRGGMGMSTDFCGSCRFRFLVLLGILFSPTVTLDTKNINVRAGPDRDVARPAYPDPCETQAHELATGVAVEVRDLVVLAQQSQLSTGGEVNPFAEQLLAITARIEARLDQHHCAPAVLIVPGGTVYRSAALRDVGNATQALALGLRGHRAAPAPLAGWGHRRLPQEPVVKPGDAVPPAPILRTGARLRDLRIRTPEGVIDQSVSWDEPLDENERHAVYLFALVFVGIIASAPFVPHLQPGAPPPTKAHYCESFCLYVWLLSGLYLFTNVVLFQSPHFATSRTLRLEESVYFISQIVTTVGYGDVTPAQVPGQLVVGIYAFVSTMIVTQVLSELVSAFQTGVEKRVERISERVIQRSLSKSSAARAETRRQKLWVAFTPVIQSGGVFVLFVILGSLFFCLYPGEGKTLGEAVYMSTITLSTVGFGMFTPVTRTGMVFGAYWMLFGVGSLGALVSARVTFFLALVQDEREKDSKEVADQIDTTEHIEAR